MLEVRLRSFRISQALQRAGPSTVYLCKVRVECKGDRKISNRFRIIAHQGENYAPSIVIVGSRFQGNGHVHVVNRVV